MKIINLKKKLFYLCDAGKYGVPQPWYFPVTHTFWCSCFRAKKSVNFDLFQVSDAAGKNYFHNTFIHILNLVITKCKSSLILFVKK